MRIAQLYQGAQPVFSFEFFPPKTVEGAASLRQTLAHVQQLQPGFISITYGAGGSTRLTTFDLALEAKRTLGLEVMVHLTCVGHSAAELTSILDSLHSNGIENIIALRGDAPKDTQFTPHPQGFKNAIELVRLARQQDHFCVAAAAYPEGHVQAANRQEDWTYLLQKVRAGAEVLFTQLFLDNADFFALQDFLKSNGVDVPLIPGIMPISNVAQLIKFGQMCGCRIPTQVQQDLQAIAHDPVAVADYGVAYAQRQCRDLLARGVRGIHFYTLNKSDATRRVIEGL